MHYINCINKEIQFSKDYIVTDASDLFKHKWTYDTKYSRITKYKKEIDNFKIVISMPINKVDELQEILDKDVKEERKGRFYCGNYYMKCMCIESSLKSYSKPSKRVEIQLTFVSDDFTWKAEKLYSFRGTEISKGKNMDFESDFDFDFASNVRNQNINNSNYVSSNFNMIIYGPVTAPEIVIAGHKYAVNVNLEKQEYISINSVEKTIIMTQADGNQRNCFDLRNRESYIFEKIPTGVSKVATSTTFDFDILLYEERGEPKWI